MLTLLFIILAGIGYAFIDRIDDENFRESIFKNWNEKFWYKRVSWIYAKRIFKYPVDAWHLGKSFVIISFVLAAVFYKPVVNWWLDALACGIIYIITFNIFYNRIFEKK